MDAPADCLSILIISSQCAWTGIGSSPQLQPANISVKKTSTSALIVFVSSLARKKITLISLSSTCPPRVVPLCKGSEPGGNSDNSSQSALPKSCVFQECNDWVKVIDMTRLFRIIFDVFVGTRLKPRRADSQKNQFSFPCISNTLTTTCRD